MATSDKKIIMINPTSLTLNQRVPPAKRTLKIKPITNETSLDMKKKMMKKIKDFQVNNSHNSILHGNADTDNSFENEFNRSLSFLVKKSSDTLSNKKKKIENNSVSLEWPTDIQAKPISTATAPAMPIPIITAPTMPIPVAAAPTTPIPVAAAPTISIPIITAPTIPIHIAAAPSRPIPIAAAPTISIPIITAPTIPIHIAAAQTRPIPNAPAPTTSIPSKVLLSRDPIYGNLKNGLKKTFRSRYNNNNANINKPLEKKTHHIKPLSRTRSVKYIVGKNIKNNTVSVLVPNETIRKNASNAHDALIEKPISEIRAYLQKNNLIKVGSHLPEGIMKEMYESAMIAGKINNTNNNILFENYNLQ
jgi:hypothetical protein